jgi:hypothetical protein
MNHSPNTSVTAASSKQLKQESIALIYCDVTGTRPSLRPITISFRENPADLNLTEKRRHNALVHALKSLIDPSRDENDVDLVLLHSRDRQYLVLSQEECLMFGNTCTNKAFKTATNSQCPETVFGPCYIVKLVYNGGNGSPYMVDCTTHDLEIFGQSCRQVNFINRIANL